MKFYLFLNIIGSCQGISSSVLKHRDLKVKVMAGKKKIEKKSAKIKLKQMKKIESPVPRLRLEPRLTPSPSKKIKSPQNLAHGFERTSSPSKKIKSPQNLAHGFDRSPFSEERELATNVCEEESSHDENSNEEQQRNEVFDYGNLLAEKESRSYDAGNTEYLNPKSSEIEGAKIKGLGKKSKQKIKTQDFKGSEWNDREWMDLALGFQNHGFSDLQKIADCVKTKNQNDIRQFIKLRRIHTVRDPNNKKWNRQGNEWNTLRKEYLATWPNIRKWRKLAYEQMLLYTRSKDYSKPVLSALCKKFYEEEKETSDPQVINVKLIYKYLMSCMSGSIPPQLPPKESALVLDLLREVRLMPIAYDFEEERKFLQDFRSATKFKPFQVKDEFRKRYKKVPDEMLPPNTVTVPEEVFLELSRHKRLTQSFSPMVTPVWMLQKEQETLEKYSTESSVYVD